MAPRQTTGTPTIFMVEDEEDTASLLILLLGAYGCEIEHATDERQAQHMIDTLASPNLVLLDIMLPHLSGLELLPYIRQKSGWHNVPVIMLTADSDEHNVKQALADGANDYLVKPFHEGLPGCPARKSGEEWQPVAKRRQIPSWFTKAPPGRAGFFTPTRSLHGSIAS